MRWILLAIAVILISVIVKLYPMVSGEKACYEDANKKIADIQYFVASRGISKESVCNGRSNVLMDLDECVKAATAGSGLTKQAAGIVEGMVYLVRPLNKSIGTLEREHNEDCSEFPSFQL
jgi:hypothetical protein